MGRKCKYSENYNFKNYVLRIPADEVIVVGSVGQKLIEFSSLKDSISYTYFPLSDSSTDRENLENILRHCLDFKTIVIFYTKFVEILNQNPVKIRWRGI